MQERASLCLTGMNISFIIFSRKVNKKRGGVLVNAQGQGKGAIVGLLAVIVIAGYFIVRQAAPTRYRPPQVDWACEECDHMFTAPVQWGNRDCPRCPGEAVRTHIYYDTVTGELIEVYREKPAPGADPAMPDPDDRLVQVPGGEWQQVDYEQESLFGIPVEVDNAEYLRYAPPGSEYRQ